MIYHVLFLGLYNPKSHFLNSVGFIWKRRRKPCKMNWSTGCFPFVIDKVSFTKRVHKANNWWPHLCRWWRQVHWIGLILNSRPSQNAAYRGEWHAMHSGVNWISCAETWALFNERRFGMAKCVLRREIEMEVSLLHVILKIRNWWNRPCSMWHFTIKFFIWIFQGKVKILQSFLIIFVCRISTFCW